MVIVLLWWSIIFKCFYFSSWPLLSQGKSTFEWIIHRGKSSLYWNISNFHATFSYTDAFFFFPDLPQMMTWPSLSVLSCLCWERWKRRWITFAPTNGEQNFMQIGCCVLCGILPTLSNTCTGVVDFLIRRYKNLKSCEKILGQFMVLLFSCL